jgi:protein tyrosine phosphatase (PTP) superfamily phosphohydrolase (DUF442 family)
MNEYLKTYLDYRIRTIIKDLNSDNNGEFILPLEFKYIPQNIKERIAKGYGIPIELMDENPSEEVQLEAVRKNGYNIKHIHNPSKKIQLEAVRENGDSIMYVLNPSEEVQLEAVKQSGLAIEFIKNPSEQVQLEAVRQNWSAVEFIENPTFKVIELYIKQSYKS